MRYRNTQPCFIIARFASTCPETGKPIAKGDTIAYYPNDRRAFHESSQSAENVRALQFSKTWEMADANW
jgi:hypothetical protein